MLSYIFLLDGSFKRYGTGFFPSQTFSIFNFLFQDKKIALKDILWRRKWLIDWLIDTKHLPSFYISTFCVAIVYRSQDSLLWLLKVLSAEVGVPLQGNGKFYSGAYYVVGCLLRLIVVSAFINNYLLKSAYYKLQITYIEVIAKKIMCSFKSQWKDLSIMLLKYLQAFSVEISNLIQERQIF